MVMYLAAGETLTSTDFCLNVNHWLKTNFILTELSTEFQTQSFLSFIFMNTISQIMSVNVVYDDVHKLNINTSLYNYNRSYDKDDASFVCLQRLAFSRHMVTSTLMDIIDTTAPPPYYNSRVPKM